MPKIQLSKNFIRSTCKLALNEDLYPSGDITTNLLNNNLILDKDFSAKKIEEKVSIKEKEIMTI